MQKPRLRIALGLSGGVDSAVAAYLLQKEGHSLTAVYLDCWNSPGCRAETDRQDALKVAIQLNIPFQVLDFQQAYQEKVMAYLLEEYRASRTPNPDVLCNQVIKFGLFFEWAKQQGFESVATGHYAQINRDLNQHPLLVAGHDIKKDQSYFLHHLTSDQLQHILFPIGSLTKKEVRKIALQAKLPVATKKDSMGICFVGKMNMRNFLENKLGTNPGKIVNTTGEEIGEHLGLWFYTIGQRHGFQLDSQKVKQYTDWYDSQGNLPPLFVIRKETESNQLVIGRKLSSLVKTWQIHALHRIDSDFIWSQYQLLVKVRNTGQLLPCQLKQQSSNQWQVEVGDPVAGIAPGQFSVFYVSESQLRNQTPSISSNNSYLKPPFICLGGGVIL